MSDPDVIITDSGGRMVRLRETGTPPGPVDLALLEDQRTVEVPGPVRPAGQPPYLAAGEVLTWHWGRSLEPLRVVRDDERGLVAWLPRGSEVLAATPLDGRELRDRPLEERFTAAYELRLRAWRGPGILRVAPTGRPWSVWYFWADGRFEGHYVNLELPHVRPADGSPRVLSRDLVLDVWLENGEVWLKDEDELEAATASGRFTPEQAAVVRALGALAAHELGHLRSWPLDAGWEHYAPPPGWDEPLALPTSPAVVEARARGVEEPAAAPDVAAVRAACWPTTPRTSASWASPAS